MGHGGSILFILWSRLAPRPCAFTQQIKKRGCWKGIACLCSRFHFREKITHTLDSSNEKMPKTIRWSAKGISVFKHGCFLLLNWLRKTFKTPTGFNIFFGIFLVFPPGNCKKTQFETIYHCRINSYLHICIYIYVYMYIHFLKKKWKIPKATQPKTNCWATRLAPSCRLCEWTGLLWAEQPELRVFLWWRGRLFWKNHGNARWWFQIFFIFTPKIGEDSHFDSYFSNGLV